MSNNHRVINQFSLTFDNAFNEFVTMKTAIYPDIATDPKAREAIREIFEAGFVAGMTASALDQFRARLPK